MGINLGWKLNPRINFVYIDGERRIYYLLLRERE